MAIMTHAMKVPAIAGPYGHCLEPELRWGRTWEPMQVYSI